MPSNHRMSQPTNVEELYLLSGIAPPSIIRDVCARVEKVKQEQTKPLSLHGQIPAEKRLKSRNCFIRSVNPANSSPKVIRCSEWLRRTNNLRHPIEPLSPRREPS